MFNWKNLELIFCPVYLGGLGVVLSAQSFFSAWVGLELNTLSFLALLKHGAWKDKETSSLKYFLVQSFSSSSFLIVFFFSISTSMMFSLESLLTLSLLFKLGAFPFQAWLVSLSKSISLQLLGLMLTAQKLSPLWILFKLVPSLTLLGVSVGMSILFSMLGAGTSTKFVVIMSYSSLFNLALMLIISKEMNFLFTYFFSYSLSLGVLLNIFSWGPPLTLKEINFLNMNFFSKMGTFFMFMNLAGVPPFLNAWSKFAVFSLLMLKFEIYMFFVVILASFFFIYVYARMSLILVLKLNLTKQSFFAGAPAPLFLVMCLMSFLMFFI